MEKAKAAGHSSLARTSVLRVFSPLIPSAKPSTESALCTKCLVSALAGWLLSVTANVRTKVVVRLYLRAT